MASTPSGSTPTPFGQGATGHHARRRRWRHTGKLARNVSVYGDASYLTSVSGESRITLKGNVGVRVTW
jgi:hypothetical protein